MNFRKNVALFFTNSNIKLKIEGKERDVQFLNAHTDIYQYNNNATVVGAISLYIAQKKKNLLFLHSR